MKRVRRSSLSIGLPAKYGRAALVDDKAGANGNIGIEQVELAAPDGHMLPGVPAGDPTISPSPMLHLGYSVDADFLPISTLAKAPNLFAAKLSVPAVTIKEWVAVGQVRPDSPGFAAPGVDGGLPLARERPQQQSGADLLDVPCKARPPALNEVLREQVAGTLANLPSKTWPRS